MICYFPLTYIPRRRLRWLTSQIGVLTVYGTDPSLVPDHMRQAAETGDLDLRLPGSIGPGRLLPAIQAYREWADLHQGNLADLAGFFKAARAGFPMMDETNPSQISTQVRNYGESAAAADEDPMLQAALFLSLAQAHDRQQAEMRDELGAIQSMEQQMLNRLAGDPQAGAETLAGSASAESLADPEPGGYMTGARMQAWAQLAMADDDPAHIYVTGSPAAMDHLLSLFPEASESVHLALGPDAADGATVESRRETLMRLVRTSDPVSPPAEGPRSDAAAAGLTLHKLAGISPRNMLRRLCPAARPAGVTADGDGAPGHVLIGQMTPG